MEVQLRLLPIEESMITDNSSVITNYLDRFYLLEGLYIGGFHLRDLRLRS